MQNGIRVEPITITYHKLNGEPIEVVAYDVTEIGNEIEFIEVTRMVIHLMAGS